MATKRIPILDGADKVPVAQLPVGTAAGTVAAGDDARIVGALPKTGGTMTGQLYTADGARLPLTYPSYRRPRWRDTTGYAETFQTGHGWVTNGSGVATSNLNDTASFCRGTQSATVTSDGTLGHTAAVRKTSIAGLSSLDLTDKMFRLVVRVEAGLAALSNLNFFLGTSGFTNYFKWVLNPVTASSNYVTQGQWVTLTFGWGDLNSAAGTMTIGSTGAPSTRTGFTDMQVQVTDAGVAGGCQLRVQAVEIIDATTTTFPNGVISLTFDDSWQSQWDLARPAMDTYGFRGTQYTIVDQIGTASHVTLDQLQRLQGQSGWEIGGHAYTAAAHTARLTTFTAAQVDQEIGDLKTWLVQHGFDGDSFAYPGGQFEQTTDAVWVEDICARYFSSNRSILAQPTKAVETFPAPMPHRLRAISGVSSLNAANGLNNPAGIVAAGGILDKILTGGGWLIMCFHDVVSGSPSATTQINVTDFQTIMAGINSRAIPVLPVSDVIRYYA
jgi:peptidoglycan/xylan/chitin deacetylase (PgdA/CDA1 family)